MKSIAPEHIELALWSLRDGSDAPLSVSLHGVPRFELHPVDARKVRAALRSALKSLKREAAARRA